MRPSRTKNPPPPKVLSRAEAAAPAARALREEKNLVTLVTEILEEAAAKGKTGERP